MENQLIFAAKDGDISKVTRLMGAGVDPSADGNLAIMWAAGGGHIRIVQLLLQDPRVDPSDNGNVAIILAAQNGHLEVVRLLLQEPRVDPADDNNATIRHAARNGHVEVVRLLMQDPRVDPSDATNAPIRIASRFGHLEVVRLLLQDPRVDPSDFYNQPIRFAVSFGHVKIVQLLATIPGIIVDTVDYYLENNNIREIHNLASMTGSISGSNEDLLVWAASVGSLNLVKYLIALGTNPTFFNNSPITAANRYEHTHIVNYLLTLSGVHL